ncbi:IMPACT family protein [Aeromicrobium phragmitis]|uniref:IMPACT family protein n=1 Tax=Aeromicrobium phragmitis TaxID=2478914 RepID=UPI001FB592FF|nr:YigZ family protein [Aeromicrobium phragmitis]
MKRSRFLAQACRVESEEHARAFIADVRAAHHDARHHCTAFVIGARGDLQRSNDDGEPAGTAGRPMLEVVTGRELSDVVVVVTRWFGGILLGAGGLVRAYGDATTAVLDRAGVRRRVELALGAVAVPMADAGAFEHRLRQATDVVDVRYEGAVTFTVAAPDLEELGRQLAAWSSGSIRIEPMGSQWRDVPNRTV